MNESRPNAKSPFRPILILVTLFLVVPLLTCGGILTWVFGRQSSAAKELMAQQEALRADGKPVDDESLTAFHDSLTSDRNTDSWFRLREQTTAQGYWDGTEKIPIVGAQGVPVPPPGEPWPDEQEVRAFLSKSGPLLEKIRSLSMDEMDPGTKPLRRPITYEGFLTLLPDAQESRSFARMLNLDFDVALRDGNADRAFESIRAMQGLRRSFDGEPLLVSQLVGIAIGSIGNNMIRRALEADLFSEDQLKTIFNEIEGFKKSAELFQLAMVGERAMALPMFSDPERAREMLEMETGSGGGRMTEWMTKMRSKDGVAYLEEISKFEKFPTDSMKGFRKAGEAWDANLKNQAANASMFEKMDKAMTFISLPAIGVAARAFVREAESNNLTRLAIAARLYRYQFDRWPASLTELESVGISSLDMETSGANPFGFQPGGDDNEIVLWGIDTSQGQDIPLNQPPQSESDDDVNAGWVYRVRMASP